MNRPRRQVPGTFDVMTRLNVTAAACALLGAVVATGCWRAGLSPLTALVAGAAGGACCAVAAELRRGRAGRPGAIVAFYVGWAILLGPLAWVLVAVVWGVGGV